MTYDLGGDALGSAVLVQDPPRRRVDLTTEVEGRTVTRSVIADDDRSVVCERAGGEWACRRGGPDEGIPGAFGPEQVERAVRDLARARDAYTFRTGSRTVAGVNARCLVTELAPGRDEDVTLGRKGTLCVSEEGVPLLVETAASSLRAVQYTTTVASDAFDAPAPVQR